MRRLAVWLAAAFCLSPCGAAGQEEEGVSSLDDLLKVKISTASKYEQTARQAPASVSIITSEEIEQFGYRTLTDVLQAVRGFYISDDRNYSYVGVRGFSRPGDYNNRILLLIDGHTLNESVYGSAPLGSDLALDLSTVERIEIVRGPGSVLYGTGAMFAVVNIILKKGSAWHGGRLAGEVGSFSRFHGSLSAGRELANGLDVMGSVFGTDVRGDDLFYPEYDSPETNHGVAKELDNQKHSGFVATATYGDFRLAAFSISREKGIPTGAFGVEFNNREARTTDRYRFLELKYSRDLSPKLALQARAYADDYRYRGSYPYEILSQDATDNDRYGGELQVRWDSFPGNRLTAGAEYKENTRADYRNFDANQTYFRGDFPFNVFSLYLQDEYQISESLALTAGLRYDRYSAAVSSTKPRAALVWNPSASTTLKLLYGGAFRVPNIYETRYEDALSGAKANPDLKPEKIQTTEAVWEQRLGPVLFGVLDLYHSRMTDLIDQRVDPADGFLQFRNVSAVRAYGVGLELTARFRDGRSAYASYTYQRADDEAADEDLTNSPNHLARLGLSLPIGSTFRASPELYYETSRLTLQGTRTDPYLLTNLTVSVEPPNLPLRLQLQVRNLFGVDYASPGGFEHRQAAIPQDGRTYSAKLECRF